MPTSADTYSFGVKLGHRLQPGAIVLLNGDLGAGKTLLTQGIAAGLGSADTVSSPTFALVNIYSGRCPIYHFDLYRLENSSELDGIGFFEMLEEGAVSVIEWADKFASRMPDNAIKITLQRLTNGAGRRLIIEADNVDISD
ncbi:MAG: tRNA (adenosine(37)-N6)-threonylcarbamoyltransferase complex ATPase subunit type 1 TsaE [Bacillota bacterium]